MLYETLDLPKLHQVSTYIDPVKNIARIPFFFRLERFMPATGGIGMYAMKRSTVPQGFPGGGAVKMGKTMIAAKSGLAIAPAA